MLYQEQLKKILSPCSQNQVLVQRNDSELLMIDELRRTIEHLEHEDNKKTEERHKYARDIEQVIAIQVARVKLPQKKQDQMKIKECKTNTLLCTHVVLIYRWKSIISWKPKTT